MRRRRGRSDCGFHSMYCHAVGVGFRVVCNYGFHLYKIYWLVKLADGLVGEMEENLIWKWLEIRGHNHMIFLLFLCKNTCCGCSLEA